MSCLKTKQLEFSECSCVMIASLAVYMQQTLEQYGTPSCKSLEPAHCMKAIFNGSSRSLGRNT